MAFLAGIELVRIEISAMRALTIAFEMAGICLPASGRAGGKFRLLFFT